MRYLRPASWQEAVALKTEEPDALPINGGTDVMVEVNFDRSRPNTLLDLSHLKEINQWEISDRTVHVGAGVTYSSVINNLADALPGLAIASRTVGSPQIRNRGTVAGNLASGSPAGDSHPPLLASRAVVEVESIRGSRSVPIGNFYTGVKQTVLEPDELIRAIVIPRATGPQEFSKIGTRNAMVIAVVSFAVSLDPERRKVGTGIGSAAPTPIAASAAEKFLEEELAESDYWTDRRMLPAALLDRFGELVTSAASPIDDIRGSAEYRRHALNVIATRALGWAWTTYMNRSSDAG